ncbi:hypothetical protein H9P43_004113 [Blastocladiella emersonii ATCC 22665]|nr:hypothetical protein H9P43_004113 [Blastocladiella emersonii ATCC 22665]
MSATRVFMEISAGSTDVHAAETAAYARTIAFLRAKGSMYGLPPTAAPESLSEDQRELLASVWEESEPARLDPPTPLALGRVVIELADATAAPKAHANFVALCTGSKGMSKAVKTAALHYRGVPLHRVERGFVAQGGDVTRHDGSGGDSIYNGKFNDEKGGLRKGWTRGTVAYANSGKNSNTSQFFFVLSDDAAKYAKLEGKHVVIGQVVEGLEVLAVLDARCGSANGTPNEPVWVSDCELRRSLSTGPIAIRATERAGFGVVATEDIPRGTTVLRAPALATLLDEVVPCGTPRTDPTAAIAGSLASVYPSFTTSIP